MTYADLRFSLFSDSQVFFCTFIKSLSLLTVNPLKHHVIPIISIIQGTVHTADCRRGCTCFLRYFQIGFLLSQHLCDLESLR